MAPALDIITCTDADDLARRAAAWLCGRLEGTGDRLAVALSGGSTPKRLYGLLTADPLRRDLPWDRIHWFWGDERVVPKDDPMSNRRMALEAMLDHVPAPPGLIHPVPVDLSSPAECAAAYDTELRQFQSSRGGVPLFDIVLLGLGPDGHTASLFPNAPALQERQRLAIDTEAGMEPFVPRVTLTFPAIASSRSVAFLVSGADKREALRRIRAGEDVPAAHVTSEGPVVWFVDEAALG
jgi:6-phosphogluconolactonase